MVFCDKCGTMAANETSKFCHKCGAPLIVNLPKEDTFTSSKIMDDKLSEVTTNEIPLTLEDRKNIPSQNDFDSSSYEKGTKHEALVEKILKNKGYKTELRKRIRGNTGVIYEIDIYAIKNKRGMDNELVVECKNYNRPVPREKVEAFWSRLQDLGKENGLFVVEPDFSRDAFQFGQEKGLQLWNRQYVMESSYAIDTGRASKADISKIKYNLPLKLNYEKATRLNFVNKDKVTIENVKLIWKPFYRIQYRVRCIRKDKSRRDHTIEDNGMITIDGVSKNVIQQSDRLTNVVKTLFGFQSEKESQQVKENDVFLSELAIKPEIGVFMDETNKDRYEPIVCPPNETEEDIRKRIIQFIQKEPYTVNYTLKRDENDLVPIQQVLEITPLLNEIKLDIKLVYLPIWEMEFQCKNHQYAKKITGFTGITLNDTITHCNKHFNLGILKKKNIAVCDICGEALCQDHIWQCKTCGSWRCSTHVKTCTDCQNKYCPDHISLKCSSCSEDICDTCATRCTICNKVNCKKHLGKCSKCGKIVCISCSSKEGGILGFGQKVFCKNCKL